MTCYEERCVFCGQKQWAMDSDPEFERDPLAPYQPDVMGLCMCGKYVCEKCLRDWMLAAGFASPAELKDKSAFSRVTMYRGVGLPCCPTCLEKLRAEGKNKEEEGKP